MNKFMVYEKGDILVEYIGRVVPNVNDYLEFNDRSYKILDITHVIKTHRDEDLYDYGEIKILEQININVIDVTID